MDVFFVIIDGNSCLNIERCLIHYSYNFHTYLKLCDFNEWIMHGWNNMLFAEAVFIVGSISMKLYGKHQTMFVQMIKV